MFATSIRSYLPWLCGVAFLVTPGLGKASNPNEAFNHLVLVGNREHRFAGVVIKPSGGQNIILTTADAGKHGTPVQIQHLGARAIQGKIEQVMHFPFSNSSGLAVIGGEHLNSLPDGADVPKTSSIPKAGTAVLVKALNMNQTFSGGRLNVTSLRPTVSAAETDRFFLSWGKTPDNTLPFFIPVFDPNAGKFLIGANTGHHQPNAFGQPELLTLPLSQTLLHRLMAGRDIPKLAFAVTQLDWSPELDFGHGYKIRLMGEAANIHGSLGQDITAIGFQHDGVIHHESGWLAKLTEATWYAEDDDRFRFLLPGGTAQAPVMTKDLPFFDFLKR